ncbi:hypothetical protein [Nocardia sp. NPDC004604]|uniref:hypothetical protein n=1 Tax=Nocardia sp. NPDC004604 TaxID=3157013 RepID=UPI0033A603FE
MFFDNNANIFMGPIFAANSQPLMEARRTIYHIRHCDNRRHAPGYQLGPCSEAAGNQSAFHEGEDGIADLAEQCEQHYCQQHDVGSPTLWLSISKTPPRHESISSAATRKSQPMAKPRRRVHHTGSWMAPHASVTMAPP